MTEPLLVGVDVGTLSARAGLFDGRGRMLHAASAGFELLRPAENQAAYRMDDIWAAVGEAVRLCLGETPGAAGRVAALAFDATSSLALRTDGARPLAGGADVLCWMDHRGEPEAEEISRSGDRLLAYTGGTMSPEIHLPKLLWLKRHDPAAWARVLAARDLCDELAFRATGTDRHSLCGLACKWPYLPADAQPWRGELLDRLGLHDLLDRALPDGGHPVGAVHGRLSPEGARALGLAPGLPVAVGLIDAEAGTLGVLGRDFRGRTNEICALIGGTSSSYMAFARDERAIPGVWGPFKDAVFPGYWLHEAGQSLTGAALDAVLAHHPAGPRTPSRDGHAAAAAAVLARLDAEGPAFAARRHIVPDWLGNRSPLGDGAVRALVTGVGEDASERSFHEAYYATARAIVLQARHIVEHLNAHGYAIRRVALSGGHLRNPLLVRLYQDALGFEAVVSRTPEPVLLGTAMTAAVAAGHYPDLFAAVDAMAPEQEVLEPDPAWAEPHALAYSIYRGLFAARNEAHDAGRRLQALAHQREKVR
ncbi:FGGY-family carbohydrate kinase [Salinarimonas soli]|uniref:Ribulokinase n=1 Tax=Salinarimonas soli TaxID=1638099 RepID=A0A5B2VWX7_9HYPH|nr:FGGY-family carbohydrate kinase [Salinarimonas soli]KAA2244333.1 ribulokinase [Salinarimonas soli]